MDFFVEPTFGFRLLYMYMWFAIDHQRRRIIHLNVAAHPTSQWVIQQLRESFPDDTSPNYLVFDSDTIFSSEVLASMEALQIAPK